MEIWVVLITTIRQEEEEAEVLLVTMDSTTQRECMGGMEGTALSVISPVVREFMPLVAEEGVIITRRWLGWAEEHSSMVHFTRLEGMEAWLPLMPKVVYKIQDLEVGEVVGILAVHCHHQQRAREPMEL